MVISISPWPTMLQHYNETGGVFDNLDAWEEVTTENAFAVATAERKNTIIPDEEFRNIIMEPKESRLIYIALPSEEPLLRSSDKGAEFDETYAKNNELATHVGYAVTGSELFGNTVENHPFHGIVHYNLTLPCDDERDSFAMELPYFVDEKNPSAVHTSRTTHAIQNALLLAMSRDAKLIRMQNMEGLIFDFKKTETNVVDYEGMLNVLDLVLPSDLFGKKKFLTLLLFQTLYT